MSRVLSLSQCCQRAGVTGFKVAWCSKTTSFLSGGSMKPLTTLIWRHLRKSGVEIIGWLFEKHGIQRRNHLSDSAWTHDWDENIHEYSNYRWREMQSWYYVLTNVQILQWSGHILTSLMIWDHCASKLVGWLLSYYSYFFYLNKMRFKIPVENGGHGWNVETWVQLGEEINFAGGAINGILIWTFQDCSPKLKRHWKRRINRDSEYFWSRKSS